MVSHVVGGVHHSARAVDGPKVPQLDETQTPMVMHITEFHRLGKSCDAEDVDGIVRGLGRSSVGGDVGATMETQCPMVDP